MPRLIKPKVWQSGGWLKRERLQPAVFQSLCVAAGIRSDTMKDAKKRLRLAKAVTRAVAVYRAESLSRTNEPRPAHIRVALDRVRRLTEDLADALGTLDEHSIEAIDDARNPITSTTSTDDLRLVTLKQLEVWSDVLAVAIRDTTSKESRGRRQDTAKRMLLFHLAKAFPAVAAKDPDLPAFLRAGFQAAGLSLSPKQSKLHAAELSPTKHP